MKKLKSFVAGVLLAVFGTVCFSACGGSGDGGNGNSEKTTEEKVESVLKTAYSNLHDSSKYSQTFSSSYVDENGVTISAENSEVLNSYGITVITTNVVDGVEVNYYNFSDEAQNYYVTYETKDETVTKKLYNSELKTYRETTSTANEYLQNKFEENRADYDYISMISHLKTELASETGVSSAYTYEKSNDVIVATFSRTQTDIEKITLTYEIKNSKLISYSVKTENLLMNQTTNVSCEISYTADTLNFDSSNYLNVNFDPVNYLYEIYSGLEENGMSNHFVTTIETETDGTETDVTSYKTAYSKADGIEKVLVTDESNQAVEYYEFEYDALEEVYKKRVYDISDKTYTETVISKVDYLNFILEFNLEISHVKMVYDTTHMSDAVFMMTLQNGSYVYSITSSQSDDFSLTLIMKNDKIVSLAYTETGLEINSTCTYSTENIAFDVSDYAVAE